MRLPPVKVPDTWRSLGGERGGYIFGDLPPVSFFLSLVCSLSFCFSLSLSPLSCFFFLALRALSRSLSLSSGVCLVSLFPAILMNLREVFRERHFAAQKRARFNARKEREREREKETRESARAQANTLYRRKFLSFALSLCHYREELTTTRKTEYSFLSCTRKTENSHVFPGKPSS